MLIHNFITEIYCQVNNLLSALRARRFTFLAVPRVLLTELTVIVCTDFIALLHLSVFHFGKLYFDS